MGVKNWGMGHRILTVNEIVIFRAHNFCAKFNQKSNKNCDRRSADRHTDRQKDARDFIICAMLCYSSGTDKN